MRRQSFILTNWKVEESEGQISGADFRVVWRDWRTQKGIS